jgi:hypothetical protein
MKNAQSPVGFDRVALCRIWQGPHSSSSAMMHAAFMLCLLSLIVQVHEVRGNYCM